MTSSQDLADVNQQLRETARRNWWQWAILAGLVAYLYWSILARLVTQWANDQNYSHGFFVPLFSAYVLWSERKQLATLRSSPSWWGIGVVGLALCVLIVGVFGAELFLSRSSLVLLLGGLVILFRGWRFFRAVIFPWAFLFLMIPLPAIIFNQIAFPLQLLASKLASALLTLLGVPVLREGNVIQLPVMTLEVVEACSGIRSLMSLGTLAIIYGYFLESGVWRRVLLALGAIPIAVAANALRVMGTGLLGQYWDPDKAQGFFHAFSGWLIFVMSLLLLFGLHGLLRIAERWFLRRRAGSAGPSQPVAGATQEVPTAPQPSMGIARLVVVVLLMAGAGLLMHARDRAEQIPQRQKLADFPRDIGGWNGYDVAIEPEVLKILGDGEFLLRVFRSEPDQPFVDFFLAYFPSQRTGSTIHSPQNCLPGAGWTPAGFDRIQLIRTDGKRITVNRYVIAKGLDRQVVLYWYQSNGRVVASEYWAKFFLVADSIRLNRSDGALVRVVTPVMQGEEIQHAERRAAGFAETILPVLDSYIPQ